MDESTSPWDAVGACLLGAVGVMLLASFARALVPPDASLRTRAIFLAGGITNPLIAFLLVAGTVALIAHAQTSGATRPRRFTAAFVLSVIVAALMVYAAFEAALGRANSPGTIEWTVRLGGVMPLAASALLAAVAAAVSGRYARVPEFHLIPPDEEAPS